MRPARPSSFFVAVALALLSATVLPLTAHGNGFTGGLALPGIALTSAKYVVQAGDTLYGIATHTGISASDAPDWIDSVVKLNGLSDADHLSVGQQLQLPDGSAASPSSGSTASSAATSSYTVQPGDTLGGIGDKLGLAGGALQDWIARVVKLNSLASADALTAGQKLQVPGALTAGAGTAQAASSLPAPPLATLTYTVQPGDTLAAIGSRFGVADADLQGWLASVVTVNGLDTADRLSVGQQLRLPGVAGASAAAAASTAPATPPPPAPGASVAYTIQAGDTISSIGAKLGISGDRLASWVEQVLRLSGLASTDLLHEGQVIQIPVAEDNASLVHQATGTADSADTKAPSAVGSGPSVPYTVQPGDSLSAIGDKFGITPSQLPDWIALVLKLNGLSDANSIAAGKELRLPAPPSVAATTLSSATQNGPDKPTSESSCFYTVRSGDSWQTIATKLGVPVAGLQAWVTQVSSLNGIDPALLPIGDALRIPC